MTRGELRRQLHRRIANDAKADPTDQLRTKRLGIADGGLGLPERADIRAERYDAAKHQGNRSQRSRLPGPKQAEQGDDQQENPTADRSLRRQNELPATLGGLRKRLDPLFEP